MKIAACIEYDGSKFYGWQRQNQEPTVQSAVEAAFTSIADENVSVQCAGRTDTGVHACGQIVHFETTRLRNSHNWVAGANSKLPDGVSVLWTREVDTEFHARFSALARTYRYVILNRRIRPTFLARKVTWFFEPLEIELMQEGASQLVGLHDFSALRSAHCSSKNPVKQVNFIDLQRQGDWIWLDIEADGFLHHMVRNIVGVLFSIGCGVKSPEWVSELIAGKDRTKAGITAPPDGLYFVKVTYPKEFDLPPPSPPCKYW